MEGLADQTAAIIMTATSNASRRPDPVTPLLLQALSGHAIARPPFWFMRQAGRYLPEYREVRAQAGSFLDLCYNPELAVRVTLQPIERFRPDAAILFSDILVIPHALGQSLRFEEGRGPLLDAVRSREGLAGLSGAKFETTLAPVLETVAGVRAALPEDVALIGFAGAPWTVATYMVEGGTSRDFATVKSWALRDPEAFGDLLDMLVSSTADYLCAQIAAGAQAVQLFDTWAGAVPAGAFERLVIDPTRRIVEAVRKSHPHTPVIGFARGVGVRTMDYAEQTGLDAVGLDSAYPASEAARTLQPRLPVQGNLDPAYLHVGGEAMASAAQDILDALGYGPFVFNLGHGVQVGTPPEHVEALAEQVRNWSGAA